MYGWSPDDSRFALGIQTDEGANNWELVIYDGKTGKKLAELVHPGFSGAGMFTWLSATSFGYLIKASSGFNFVLVHQRPDGTWAKDKIVSGIAKNPKGLTGESENTVVWLDNTSSAKQSVYSGPHQEWAITRVNDSQYKIISAGGLALTAAGGNAQLIFSLYTGSKNQLWTFHANGTNYNIRNVDSGQNVDDWGGGSGVVVGQWGADNAKPQQLWKLTRVGATSSPTTAAGTDIIADGTYVITCPFGGNNALDDSDAGDGTIIRQLAIRAGTTSTFWKSPTNSLSQFLYCRDSGEFLLNCEDEKGSYLLCYDPTSRRTLGLGRINDPESLAFQQWRLDYSSVSPRYAAVQKDSLESIYLGNAGVNAFYFNAKTNSEPTHLDWGGGVTEYTPLNKQHFLVSGNPATDLPGIWDYDAATGSYNCLISCLDHPLRYAKYVTPIGGEMTNALGELRGYSLWSPATVSPNKKYPVILTQTVNEWLPYTQTAANLGCYFAMVTRPFWRNEHVQNWGADVTAMYQVLAQNPNVDTNRIFLWGRSLETGYLCRLFAEKRDLFEGMILFDPSGLPDLENLRGKKLFIITGNDADNAKHLKKYQEEAAEGGVLLKMILQENTAHVSDTISSERTRTIEFARFLDENL